MLFLSLIAYCDTFCVLLRNIFGLLSTLFTCSFSNNFFLKFLKTCFKNTIYPLLMSKRLMLFLYFPFIPHTSEAILNSDTFRMGLSYNYIVFRVIVFPFRNVSGQIREQARSDKCSIKLLWYVFNVIPIGIEIVN